MIRSTDSGDAQSTDCYFFDLISCTSDFSCTKVQHVEMEHVMVLSLAVLVLLTVEAVLP